MQGEAPKNIPQGLKPVHLLSAFCGTTEVVPFQKMGHTSVFPQPVKSCPFKTHFPVIETFMRLPCFVPRKWGPCRSCPAVLAAPSPQEQQPRSSLPFDHTVTEQTVSGVGQQSHATADQEVRAAHSLARMVRNAGFLVTQEVFVLHLRCRLTKNEPSGCSALPNLLGHEPEVPAKQKTLDILYCISHSMCNTLCTAWYRPYESRIV